MDTLAEEIVWHDQRIAAIIRREYMPDTTIFISPDSCYQQLGFPLPSLIYRQFSTRPKCPAPKMSFGGMAVVER